MWADDVAVDVQSGTHFPIAQGTLPLQPILGAKSHGEIDKKAYFLGTRILQRTAG